MLRICWIQAICARLWSPVQDRRLRVDLVPAACPCLRSEPTATLANCSICPATFPFRLSLSHDKARVRLCCLLPSSRGFSPIAMDVEGSLHCIVLNVLNVAASLHLSRTPFLAGFGVCPCMSQSPRDLEHTEFCKESESRSKLSRNKTERRGESASDRLVYSHVHARHKS